MSVSAAAPADLRRRAARGVMINAGFAIGLQGLGLVKAFVVAAFLSRSEYGIWGILVITLGTLGWLKQIGVSEKFVQQDDPDEERALQRAFTLDLVSNLALLGLALVMLPLFAVIYGQWDIVAPGLVLLLAIPLQSLRAPTWVFYRQLRYGRQRLLDSVDPLVSFTVTIALAIAGLGYWSLVVGFVAGIAAAALASVLASPYRLRLRWDRATMREYVAFSWPLLVAYGSLLIIPQVSMIAGEATLGLAGAGAIALASTISSYTDRVDQIVTTTLYPALCRVQDQTALLYEAFVKSNRLTLMWGIPFGAGIAVFAGDLVHFGLGDKWAPATDLIRAFGIIAACNHVAFNWSAFFRARGDTRPLAKVAPLIVVAFLVLALPLLLAFGLPGFAAGMAAMTLVSLLLRTHYVKRLFPQFRILRYAARAVAPTLPALAVVMALRAVIDERTLALALAELSLYLGLTAVATWLLEAALLREAVGYLRRRSG
ncbi:MAG: oligosaccharide flippase family protein [Solirubrobacteraceae bacterium]